MATLTSPEITAMRYHAITSTPDDGAPLVLIRSDMMMEALGLLGLPYVWHTDGRLEVLLRTGSIAGRFVPVSAYQVDTITPTK